MAEHNEIGKIGENMAKTFLMKQGFGILDLNYRILPGEIDIIAKKDKIIHFIEVKTIKVRDCANIENLTIRPEDNLTFAKWSKLIVTIKTYLKHKNISHETRYQRITARGSATDNVTLEEFIHQENREYTPEDPKDPNQMNVLGVLEMADFTLINKGTLKELHSKIDVMLIKLATH